MGTCGTLSVGVELFEWARNGFVPEDFPEIDEDDPTFLMVVKDGEDGVWLYEGTPTPLHFEDPYFSMGSGSHIATGVMYMGGNAIEAIEAANALSSGSGNGVDFLE